MKKKYFKPEISSWKKMEGVAPADFTSGLLLAAGYAVGRMVKSIEARPDDIHISSLRKVIV